MYIDDDHAFWTSWLIALCVFVVVFFGVWEVSYSKWDDKIHATQHNKHWRHGTATIIQLGKTNPETKESPVTAKLAYKDNLGHHQTVDVALGPHHYLEQKIVLDLSDSGDTFVPADQSSQRRDDPFKALANGWYPAAFIFLVGVIANVGLALIISFGLYDYLTGRTIKWLKKKEKKEEEKEQQYKLVHKQDGSLREEWY